MNARRRKKALKKLVEGRVVTFREREALTGKEISSARLRMIVDVLIRTCEEVAAAFKQLAASFAEVAGMMAATLSSIFWRGQDMAWAWDNRAIYEWGRTGMDVGLGEWNRHDHVVECRGIDRRG